MDWMTPLLDILTIAGLSILHISFITRFAGAEPKLWHYFTYFILLCLLQIILIRLSLSGICSAALELAALYGISRSVLKNVPSVSAVSSMLAVYISQLSFGITNSIEELILPAFLGGILLYLLLLLAVLASFGLCACCYMLIFKFLPPKKGEPMPCIHLLLLPGLFFFSTELYIIQTAYSTISYKSTPEKAPALLLLQTLGLTAMLCTLYAYQRLYAGFQAQAETASLLQAASAQRTYVTEARMRCEKTKAFRHDIKNHLSVLEGLLSTGRIEHALHYLKKIEDTSSSLSFLCQTGNPVIDILLAGKLESAEADGINTEVSLILPKNCGIDDFDLCTIFANALDNAINACRLADSEKSIHIRGECQGGFYMLEFENTCLPGPLPPMGTGLSNINTAARKYHGAMQTEKTADTFQLNILLSIQPGSISIP